MCYYNLLLVARDDHSDADCFACCVMTHGEQDTLWAKDEKYYIESLFLPFKADNCITLAGKPKIFFIQVSVIVKLSSHLVFTTCNINGEHMFAFLFPTKLFRRVEAIN
jgi:caspase, apoptotic cysteine protease, putative (fragment)